MITNILSVLSI